MRRVARCGALLTLVAALIAVFVRTRAFLGMPLPPQRPVLWLLYGMAGDLAVCIALVAVVAVVFARAPRSGMAVLVVVLGFDLMLQFALSEAVIFLGHAIRGDDLETGFHPLLVTGSAAGGVVASFFLMLVLFVAGVTWALRRREVPSITLPRLAIATVVLGLVAWAASPIDRGDTAQNALLGLPSMLRNVRVDKPPAVIPRPDLDLRTSRELIGRWPGTFLSNAYPLARVPPPRDPGAIALTAGPKPNFVFITVESLRAEEVGVYGNDPPGVTPHLDALAKQGIRVDPAYSTGGFTPEGELGILYGALASPWEIVIRSHPAVQIHGLPEILAANGYSFLWIHSSDATVYLGGRFYRMHGIRTIDGRDFPENAVTTSWGYSDRELMTRALDALDHLHEPFASMVLTISNHHPFQLPADAPPHKTTWSASLGQMAGHHTAAMLQTVHYSDFAIGEFFEKARSRPWFANTIFVICGDHGSAVPPAGRPMTKHVFYELRHRIPLIFYSPRLPQHGVVVPGPASQTDILPTLLGLAGIQTPLAASGRDLFDFTHDDPDRPIVSMNFDAHVLTVNRGRYSYHAVVPAGTTALTAELLVDRERDPNGLTNLIGRESAAATACRRAASIYLRTYGWIVANDRLTLPRTPRG